MIEDLSTTQYDLCVIGGGVNGAGIARDAAGRGLSVLLVEARDLACATSSASSKLIHGGLRYLEYFEFHLVRESLKEREKLLHIAPHIIRPMRFVLPHDKGQRPWWLVRLGLFLYDHLARRKTLSGSKGLNLRKNPVGAPLKDELEKGFQYSDCWVDDSRLVVLNALSASENGADILTHTRCVSLSENEQGWRVGLEHAGGERSEIQAAAVVNAAGPWVREVLDASGLAQADTPNIRLVKGSHIIINRSFEGEQAYILQQPDKRIIFVMPYEGRYTLIGTTEEVFEGDSYEVRISKAETIYLCDAYNRHFKAPILLEDVLWNYSGVRPLFDDGDENTTAVTRDYMLYKQPDSKAFLLSVFGGKLTTYRILAEEVVNRVLQDSATYGRPWTATEPLPGGSVDHGDFEAFLSVQQAQYDWLEPALLYRYARAYGRRMDRFLDGARSAADLGQHFGDGLYEAEVTYLVRHEWAVSVEDILWRRSKLGLHVNDDTVQALERALPKILKRG